MQIVVLFNLTVAHVASANMLLPTSYSFDLDNMGLSQPNNKASVRSMYLGKWRNQIASKLNPSYFEQLSKTRFVSSFNNYPASYSLEYNSFLVPVFADNFNIISEASNLCFSFSSENIELTPFGLNGFKSNYSSYSSNNALGYKKFNSQSSIVQQKYYAPGYVYSHGKTSFGIAAVLLQQKFLDDTFGSISVESSSNYSLANDQIISNINKGTGYQLSFDQRLPANIAVSMGFKSQIKMTEYNTFGQSYSDGGNFDVPSQYTLSLAMPLSMLSQNNFKRVRVSAERINYSKIDALVHSGYSEDFFRTYNSVLRQIFKLKDLTVYSVGYEQSIGANTLLSLDVFSRQQALATVPVYSNILVNDTASVSYKVGVKHKLGIGEINFFTSFSNKPLMMGVSDFGRIYKTSVGKHLEGVASWSFQF